jgi:hypothetical protein
MRKICVQHYIAKFARRERNKKKRSKSMRKDYSDEADVYCICRKGEDGVMI